MKLAEQNRLEKILDKEVNDVLPFMNSKMAAVKKSKDKTVYANIMMEFIF
jgi:hypothetical protein